MPRSIFRGVVKKVFILLNLLVAILYLIGCYNEFFFSATWWPVGLLTLSLFYLLLVLFGFFLFWLCFKSRWAFIFLAAVAFSFRDITNIIPLRLSSNFDMPAPKNGLRIMSWNVAQFDVMKYKQKPDTYREMMRLVNEYKPDIACFQEMVGGDTLADLNTPYYRKYSFYSIFEFAHKLSMPDYFYTYNFKENFLNQQHFGVIIFSRYPIINKKTISQAPHDYNSTFQYVDIVRGTDTVRVFNLHLQSLRFTATNLQYIQNPSIKTEVDVEKSKNLLSKFKKGFLRRQRQADTVRAAIDESPYPVIVCGDFNDVPNSYPYDKIGNDLQDAFVKKGIGMGRTFSGIAPTLRIDHIFVDKRFAVEQFIRIPRKLSDHFPIIADVRRLPD